MASSESTHATPGITAPVVVLNVNDDEIRRYLIGETLRGAGFGVVDAAKGSEALERLRQTPVDLVVLDVRLPDMSGFDVCRRIRAEAETAAIPVLMRSAILRGDEDRIRGLDTGADAYLAEPVPPAVFVATVRALVRARRAEEARRTSEAALLLSEARVKRLLSARVIGVVVANADRIVEANDAFLEMLGLGRSALQGGGLNWRAMTPAEYGPADDRALAELRERGECRPFEKQLLRHDGTPVPVLIGAARTSADPLEWVCFVLDLSARKQAEAEREQALAEAQAASRSKDDFLAMLGHELRNPLGAIENALAVMRRLGPGDPRATRLDEILTRQVAQLTRLVDDLLDVGRITRGEVALDRKPVDLAAAASRALESLAAAARTSQHRVTFEATPVWVSADPERMEQIVGNLVSNAAKFTPAGGEIRVTVRAEPETAMLTVEDSGVGIPAELLPRIFDIFVQGSQASKRQGGLGVGLAIVKRLVAMHDGSVEVSSEGRDRGSRFTVRLPRIPASVSSSPRPAAAGAPSPRRVLIAEDQDDVRVALCALLEAFGHEVLEAADGPAAVQRALADSPAVAIVDIDLPGLDGYAVARRIRADGRGADIRLVALTGYGQPQDRRRGQEAGFDEYLVKPVQPEKLLRVVDQSAA